MERGFGLAADGAVHGAAASGVDGRGGPTAAGTGGQRQAQHVALPARLCRQDARPDGGALPPAAPPARRLRRGAPRLRPPTAPADAQTRERRSRWSPGRRPPF